MDGQNSIMSKKKYFFVCLFARENSIFEEKKNASKTYSRIAVMCFVIYVYERKMIWIHI